MSSEFELDWLLDPAPETEPDAAPLLVRHVVTSNPPSRLVTCDSSNSVSKVENWYASSSWHLHLLYWQKFDLFPSHWNRLDRFTFQEAIKWSQDHVVKMAKRGTELKPKLNGRIISKVELCKFVIIAVTLLIVNLNAMRTLLKCLKSQIIYWKLKWGHLRSFEVISIH